jgi:hypothetical protein
MSEKTAVIHQPDFLPHLGFFHRLLRADIFIILDHVFLSKSGWVHRDKIKTPQGEQWITIPVKKNGLQPLICEAEIDYNPHYGKIQKLLYAHYSHAPFFQEIHPPLREVLERRQARLVDLNLDLLNLALNWFDIRIEKIEISSTLGIATRKSQMNADLVAAAGGTVYLSGPGAKAYHEDGPFSRAGLTVAWQDFHHPVYQQQYGSFIPYLSCIDLFFNCGIHNSQKILRSCL